mmetsp:Transcript_40714/g.95765  ORF Transcript_40714/g.95765 Transcript_40714/m.95765 type:complete len:245 (-) Transcript_40714:1003-1737(-)
MIDILHALPLAGRPSPPAEALLERWPNQHLTWYGDWNFQTELRLWRAMRMRCMISSGRRRETSPNPHSPWPKKAELSVPFPAAAPVDPPALRAGAASSRSTEYDTADCVDQNSGKFSGTWVSFCRMQRGAASRLLRASRIRLYATVTWLEWVLLRASAASWRFTSKRLHISTSTCSLTSSDTELSSSGAPFVRISAGDARYPGRLVLNHECARSWLTVMRWRGSTTSMRGIKSRHPSLRYPGMV